MPVRQVLLLGAVVATASVLFLQQAGMNPFATRENPFSRTLSGVGTPNGSGAAGRRNLAQGESAPARVPATPVDPAQTAQAETPTPQATEPMPTSPATPSAPASSGPIVDETALRYFAARGDTRRLEAEIARLRALYPQWTPPENPLAAAPQGDAQLDQMWKLYSEGKIAEVRKAISDRKAREPNWQVPTDLLDRLALAEAREQLVNASDIKQYDTVIRVASSNPAMLTCGDVDVLWRVAEAFASTDRKQRAIDAYLYVLRNCEKPEERFATMQKAMVVLPRADLDQLLATERIVDGKAEFEPVRGEIARRAIIEADADPKIVVSPADLALVEKLANEGRLQSDELLLGWYYLRRENPRAAEDWFRKARAKQNDAASSQGLALALINQDRPQEAEDILYEWRDAGDDVRAVYLAAVANMLALQPPPQFSTEVLQRAVAEVAKAKDAASAQQLGWYADGFNQFETAERWFRTALQWKPDDEPSAYGLALMRWKLGDLAGVREVQSAWTGLSERIPTVGERSVETAAIGDRKRRQVEIGVAADPSSPRPIRTTTPASADMLPPQPEPPAAQPVGRPRSDSQIQSDPAPQAAAPSYMVEDPQPVRSQPRRAKRDRVRPSGCRTTDDPEGLSPQAALARGWCLMEVNRPIEAAKAFEVALRGNGRTKGDAAYGQSLAYLRAGLNDMAAVSATKAPLNSSRSIELRAALLASRATSASQNGRYVETLLALDERDSIVPEQTDLMVLRGYAYLGLSRFGDAERVFRAAAATGNRDAMRGLNDVWAARNPRSNPN
jgi:tetratricopeptide (TPR) repeat protein